LLSSSSALFSSASANPTSAMHAPVGTKVHHEPEGKATSLLAQ
jgi:hypothetical protein